MPPFKWGTGVLLLLTTVFSTCVLGAMSQEPADIPDGVSLFLSAYWLAAFLELLSLQLLLLSPPPPPPPPPSNHTYSYACRHTYMQAYPQSYTHTIIMHTLNHAHDTRTHTSVHPPRLPPLCSHGVRVPDGGHHRDLLGGRADAGARVRGRWVGR